MLNRAGSLLLPLCCLTLATAGCFADREEGSITQANNNNGQGRFIVKFKNVAAGKAAVAAAGGALARDLPQQSAAAYYLSQTAANGLANNPNVEYVEVDQIRVPLAQTTPYGITMVQADQFAEGSGAGNITVCIIDSGYDLGHPDLQSTNVTASPDTGSGNPFNDTCGHGTHVAGTISALNNTEGVVGVVGGGAINLHIVKVFGNDTDPCAWSYSSDLVAAAYECGNNGANIISMSLGCSGGPKNGPFSCASATENNTFQDLYDNYNILSIAAAGNDGNSDYSYPASYDSVMSVAAIDDAKNVASFSQFNSAVEIAAPGVAVMSTVPRGTGSEATLDVAGSPYAASGMEGSFLGTASGALVDCGDGQSTCSGASGAVCLIQRGTITFAEKVQACEAGGGVAAIIYNNEAGMLYGTLGGVATGIPSIGVSDTDGTALLGRLGDTASVAVTATDYAALNGTSMATPHVSGVAALVWSHNPGWSASELRNALTATAEDLGAAGRDPYYGFGLVQAKAALDYLNNGPSCTPTESTESSCSDGVDNDCDGLTDGDDPDCAPSCTPTESTETSCNDGVDNDCDGDTDAADSDCQGGSCTLAQLGDSCTSDADCCSNKCKGPRNGKTCK